jgi:5-methylcytosine-specific restriction protein A
MMPNKAKRICNKAGCNEIISGTYCPEHQVEVERARQSYLADRRGSSASRGYDARWRKLRQHKLCINPFCERCEHDGLVEVATMVHHIKPISAGGKALEFSNLMSLCEACHPKEEEKSRNIYCK